MSRATVIARDASTRRSALIVEDDPTVRELGAAMLAEFDLNVEQVATAEAAIERLSDHGARVDILVADIHLAGEMNGIALARSVAILWPAISVIVTSGDGTARIDELPDSAVFVPKPWRPLDIVSAAEKAVRADHSVHAIRL